MDSDAFAQATYQVRLEWGSEALTRLAPADITVIVDVLGVSATEIAVAEARPEHPAEAPPGPGPGPGPGDRIVGALRNASAVARYVVRRQTERGARTSVNVVAAGNEGRYAVEDHLGAGAIIAALGDLGIDHCSPEAAVAAEAFRALRGAARHLLTASGSGRALEAAGRGDEVRAAAAVDASSVVPVLRDGAFVAA